MTVELLPRLKPVTAEFLWRSISEVPGDDLPEPKSIDHSTVLYTATGGTRIAPARIREIRHDLVEIAKRQGFPNASSDRQKTAFDARAARYLAEEAGLAFAECCRSGVWAYFAIVLLPDVTTWRFSRGARDRWVGGIRNTFGMLWRRGYLLGAAHSGLQDNWAALDRLTQDAFVQIVERPGVAGNPVVARAISSGWIRAADRVGQKNMEPIARMAIRWLGAYRRAYDLDSLPPQVLDSWVDDTFSRAGEFHGFKY